MSVAPGILTFENVTFGYKNGPNRVNILENADITFEEGVFYAIVGPSGSGKTTTLSLAGALDTPQSGKILFGREDIKKIGLTRYRRAKVAMIFQNYNLISYMTALENVSMALEISNLERGQRRQRALQLLEDLGLTEDEAKRNVMKLSGGQQQRVAIARALAGEAKVILADEPTGNLDAQTAKEIVSIFKDLAHRHGKCVIVVTHSQIVSAAADKTLMFERGTLKEIVHH